MGDDAIRFGGMIIGWNLHLSICTNIAGCVKFVFRCFSMEENLEVLQVVALPGMPLNHNLI